MFTVFIFALTLLATAFVDVPDIPDFSDIEVPDISDLEIPDVSDISDQLDQLNDFVNADCDMVEYAQCGLDCANSVGSDACQAFGCAMHCSLNHCSADQTAVDLAIQTCQAGIASLSSCDPSVCAGGNAGDSQGDDYTFGNGDSHLIVKMWSNADCSGQPLHMMDLHLNLGECFQGPMGFGKFTCSDGQLHGNFYQSASCDGQAEMTFSGAVGACSLDDGASSTFVSDDIVCSTTASPTSSTTTASPTSSTSTRTPESNLGDILDSESVGDAIDSVMGLGKTVLIVIGFASGVLFSCIVFLMYYFCSKCCCSKQNKSQNQVGRTEI